MTCIPQAGRKLFVQMLFPKSHFVGLVTVVVDFTDMCRGEGLIAIQGSIIFQQGS